MTVNKALSELVKRGLIERRRKSGSYVSFPQVQSAVMEIHDVKREVQSLGLDYAYRLGERAVRKMRAGDEGRIDLPLSSRLLDVTCRHFAGGRVFCLEERLINLSAVPEAETETFETPPRARGCSARCPGAPRNIASGPSRQAARRHRRSKLRSVRPVSSSSAGPGAAAYRSPACCSPIPEIATSSSRSSPRARPHRPRQLLLTRNFCKKKHQSLALWLVEGHPVGSVILAEGGTPMRSLLYSVLRRSENHARGEGGLAGRRAEKISYAIWTGPH